MSDPVIQVIDGVEVRLAAAADFRCLQRYGRVFRVFDDHDSGNISFGVDDGSQRRFIKLAGFETIEASVPPAVAIAHLRQAEQVYRDLAHPRIVPVLEPIEGDGWFGLVFPWTNATLLRRIYTDDFARFRALPVAQRSAALVQVMEAVQHIHDRGYVGIDLYDASFFYDFATDLITLCDLDVCGRRPYVNTMGRLWGSSRFMSPEEYVLGAAIDEVTNVFTLGAVAHLFLGDERTKAAADWDASDDLFQVAKRATAADRRERYQSIAQMKDAWLAAGG